MVDGSVPGGEAGWEPLLDDLEDRRVAARNRPTEEEADFASVEALRDEEVEDHR